MMQVASVSDSFRQGIRIVSSQVCSIAFPLDGIRRTASLSLPAKLYRQHDLFRQLPFSFTPGIKTQEKRELLTFMQPQILAVACHEVGRDTPQKQIVHPLSPGSGSQIGRQPAAEKSCLRRIMGIKYDIICHWGFLSIRHQIKLAGIPILVFLLSHHEPVPGPWSRRPDHNPGPLIHLCDVGRQPRRTHEEKEDHTCSQKECASFDDASCPKRAATHAGLQSRHKTDNKKWSDGHSYIAFVARGTSLLFRGKIHDGHIGMGQHPAKETA